MSFDTIAHSPVGDRILDELVRDGFAGARPLTDLSEAELYEIVTHAATEVSSEKWSACPGRFWPWEARVSIETGERLGRAVPICTAARWWSEPVGARPQVWIGRAYSAPTAGLVSRGLAGKPPAEMWTSSAMPGFPSAWWAVLKDGADGPAPEGPQAIWRITPHPDARVFEIRAPADWRWLCETFPGPDYDGWVTPGWEATAANFDGIHLTVEGLIRCQGTQVETDRGPAKLDAWDAEATAWLHWSVASLERLGTVRRTEHTSVRRGRAFRRVLRRS